MNVQSLSMLRIIRWAENAYRCAKFRYGFRHGTPTWSQEGEDMILRRLLPGKSGFYVDVGAHHPFRYSNTYFLHSMGWTGINVDPLPASHLLFKKHRPGDINLNVGISRESGIASYFQFTDPAYNTLDEDTAKRVLADIRGAQLRDISAVPLMTLADILAKHLEEGQTIDLMSIDVEGMDLQVLQSNDWTRFRPRVIVVEIQNHSVDQIFGSEIFRLLSDQKYILHSKLFHSAVFVLPLEAPSTQA